MPFGFGRKAANDPAAADGGPAVAAADARGPRSVRFHGFTEEWRLDGVMAITGRLLDALNHRNAIPLSDVRWAPADGSAPMGSAPGIQSMDPYDLIVAIATAETAASLNEEERAAHRIHKISYDVALEAPPYRVVGTVQLFPGSEPESVLERSTQMFVAVTDPTVTLNDVQLDLGPDSEAVLVNRFYIRAVDQVDKATGVAHQRLPGQSLGGVQWRERT